MGKAHDKMTLKKMKESFEEPILDELIYEVMSKDASAVDSIHDFIHSENPKFAGKSKAKRKEMALAAYYSKKNEEAVNEGLKDMAKKTFKALTGGSDKDQRKDLQRKMGVPQTGKKTIRYIYGRRSY
jgi:superfamily II DNA or RNA helicase